MRDDQLARLKELQELLADRFLLEADPREWPGDGKGPADLTQQERGDAYWCKKNAMATGGVMRFVSDVLEKRAPSDDPGQQADLDRQVREAERRSAALVQAAMDRAKRKPEFDKRVGNAKG